MHVGRAAKVSPCSHSTGVSVCQRHESDSKNEALLVVHSPAMIHSRSRNSPQHSDHTWHLVQRKALHVNAELILLLWTASDFACWWALCQINVMSINAAVYFVPPVRWRETPARSGTMGLGLEAHARLASWKHSHPCISTVETYLHRHRSFLCRRETQGEENVRPDSFITSPQKYRWIQWWKSVLRNVRKILTPIHQSGAAVSRLTASPMLPALVKQGSF